MKIQFSLEEGLKKLQVSPNDFVELFKHGSLVVEYYKPDQVDGQQPHQRDEVYVITSGNGTFDYAGEKMIVKSGDLLFVPAGVVHRFENFTADFATWVLFYGPDGGEQDSNKYLVESIHIMAKQHHYTLTVTWTGNKGEGTSSYRAYDRNHLISAENKPDIPGSSDPSFRGDKMRYNPEEMLVASLSTCHMLWFLNLCAESGVVVVEYTDSPTGIMEETTEGGGHFSEVTLYPNVRVADETMVDKANQLHHQANKLCFIANSCNFPILHKPSCRVV